jgi:hypothetical protein
MNVASSHKLSLAFDADRLVEDLGRLSTADWHVHELTGVPYIKGRYLIAQLIAAHGSARDISTWESADFRPTPVLEKCPYFLEVVSHFNCPTSRVRLMRMEPGALLEEHVDQVNVRADFQLARFHVPIVTNPDATFLLDGKQVTMAPGECWYVDVALPHGAANRGSDARIHLVLDCVVNSFVNDLVGFDIIEHRKANADNYQRHLDRYLEDWGHKVGRKRNEPG